MQDVVEHLAVLSGDADHRLDRRTLSGELLDHRRELDRLGPGAHHDKDLAFHRSGLQQEPG